jgi:hypothetical protein
MLPPHKETANFSEIVSEEATMRILWATAQRWPCPSWHPVSPVGLIRKDEVAELV